MIVSESDNRNDYRYIFTPEDIAKHTRHIAWRVKSTKLKHVKNQQYELAEECVRAADFWNQIADCAEKDGKQTLIQLFDTMGDNTKIRITDSDGNELGLYDDRNSIDGMYNNCIVSRISPCWKEQMLDVELVTD